MKRVLVANRGEIAVRIVRACHDAGIEAAAVYSEVDAEALHVRLADDSVLLGPAPAVESYLKQDALIEAARQTDADAIHPGYGFLSENAEFAQRVIEAGLIWVGPSPEVIKRMGNKSAARELAITAGVPVVPGSGVLNSVVEARAAADKIGYPVLLKAAEGGGGKGIRAIESEDKLESAYSEVVREVTAAFGTASLYLEKSLVDVRHVEVQVLGDEHGNFVHLHERDCSVQRRRQKVVEEAPAPGLAAETRTALHRYALDLAREMSYSSAGTVEFLVDRDGGIYFIEVNTRIQVEHGITELVTGVDICAEQLHIAAGGRLRFAQEDVAVSGHSLEVRINAENPSFQFLGSPGVIEYCRLPAGTGVRVDTFIESGVAIQPHYDSLIAKVMVHAATRGEARRRLARALDELKVSGIATTTQVIRNVNRQAWFEDAAYSTVTLEENLSSLIP